MSQTQIANATAAITRIHRSQTSDESQITGRCGGGDWYERLTEDEWPRKDPPPLSATRSSQYGCRMSQTGPTGPPRPASADCRMWRGARGR